MSNESCTAQLRYDVYFRASGRCECKMTGCRHHGVLGCEEPLVKGHWDVRRKIAAGSYLLSNVKAMCKECSQAQPEHCAVSDQPLQGGRQDMTRRSSAWVVQVSLTRLRSAALLSLEPGEPISHQVLE
jgi:hypothetical protein